MKTKLYTFDELTSEQQNKVINKYRCINDYHIDLIVDNKNRSQSLYDEMRCDDNIAETLITNEYYFNADTLEIEGANNELL